MSAAYQAQCTGANASSLVQCQDPHEDVRRQPAYIAQKKAFFQPKGTINNVCKDQPCTMRSKDDFSY
jgi:hypothetical protein